MIAVLFILFVLVVSSVAIAILRDPSCISTGDHWHEDEL